MRLTADTITDEQIRELRGLFVGLTAAPHVNGLCNLALGESEEACIVLVLKPHKRKQARARCAELLNARSQDCCRARKHAEHVRDVCEGQCCTTCGGPIDENEECRC